MTRTEFVEKFNKVHEAFFDDPQTQEMFINLIGNEECSLDELIGKLLHASYQLSAKFSFDVLSQVLEFDEE